MRAPDYARCSRCSAHLKHFQDPVLAECTMGYYDVRSGSSWSKFAKSGEQYICDECMWQDPRYVAIYGTQADGSR